jgi:pantoate--beta-alanine ligase
MVQDLNLPVEIVVCPIVREPDGLAMSSRNAYLGPQERRSALVLNRSLTEVRNLFDQGERNASMLIEAGKQVLSHEAGVRLDYFEIVTPSTLDSMQQLTSGALVAIAAFVGHTRLIDNILLPEPE